MSDLQPVNLEMEQSVLGAILLESDCIIEVMAILAPEDFYSPEHKLIFRAMLEMYQAGEAIDLLTVSERVKSVKPDFDDLTLPDMMSKIPSAANVAAYAGVVLKKSKLRQLRQAAAEMADKIAASDADPDEIIESHESRLLQISGNEKTDSVSLKESLGKTLDKIESIMAGKSVIGIPCGYGQLDHMLGGLPDGELVYIGARPSMGKTAFAMNLAFNVAKRGQSVAFFSLETTHDKLTMRLLAKQAKINLGKIRSGKCSEMEIQKLSMAMGILENYPIFYDDQAGLTIFDIRSRAKKLKIRHDIAVVFVDYLQLIETKRKFERRDLEVQYISGELKKLAKELNIPVVVLSQLSRAIEGRSNRRPELADFRESGSIEQDGYIIMGIFREAAYGETPENSENAEIIILKHKDGETGYVNFNFKKEFLSFSELEFSHSEQKKAPY